MTPEIEAINDALGELSGKGDEYSVVGLEDTGKALPFIGWYWRNVDFDEPITLGDCKMFTGFMENNKWGYPEWAVTPEQHAAINGMVRVLAKEPTQELLQAFFDYIQLCRPYSDRELERLHEANDAYWESLDIRVLR